MGRREGREMGGDGGRAGAGGFAIITAPFGRVGDSLIKFPPRNRPLFIVRITMTADQSRLVDTHAERLAEVGHPESASDTDTCDGPDQVIFLPGWVT